MDDGEPMDDFPRITWIGSQLRPAVDGNSGANTNLGPTASGNGSRAGGKKTACAPPGAKGGWWEVLPQRGKPGRLAVTAREQPGRAAGRRRA